MFKPLQHSFLLISNIKFGEKILKQKSNIVNERSPENIWPFLIDDIAEVTNLTSVSSIKGTSGVIIYGPFAMY